MAESICRKALLLEAKERPYDFHFTDYADDIFGHLHQRLRDFVADAHAIMLSDRDLRNAADESRDEIPALAAANEKTVMVSTA